MIQKFMGYERDPYINIKWCVKCPECNEINPKQGRDNKMTCGKCHQLFCYICNKKIQDESHYLGQSSCHATSDAWTDI